MERDRAALGLRALEQPLTEPAALADRDPDLTGLVADPLGVQDGSRNAVSRARWYALSTGVVNIATIPTTPTAATAANSFSGAPATATTPNAIATRTSADPRSGCSMTSATGTTVTRAASVRSRGDGGWSRSRRSARIIASPTHSATFMNSDGWTENPPGSWIQDRDPFTVEPSGVSTRTRPASDAR